MTAVSATVPALARSAGSHRVDRPGPQGCRCCVFGPRGGSRRFYGTEKFTPEQVRQDEARPVEDRRKSSMGASGARFATKRWPPCTGKAAPAAPSASVGGCAHSVSQEQEQQAVLPPAGLLADHRSDEAPPSSCCRSISTAGRSKSTTGKRKTLWESDKPSYGTLRQCPSNRSWPLRLTAPCYWPRCSPLVPNAERPMQRCPNGDEGPPAVLPGSGHPLRKEMGEHPELLKEFDLKMTDSQLVRSAAA